MASFKQWPGKVCEFITNLTRRKKVILDKRGAAHDKRDEARGLWW